MPLKKQTVPRILRKVHPILLDVLGEGERDTALDLEFSPANSLYLSSSEESKLPPDLTQLSSKVDYLTKLLFGTAQNSRFDSRARKHHDWVIQRLCESPKTSESFAKSFVSQFLNYSKQVYKAKNFSLETAYRLARWSTLFMKCFAKSPNENLPHLEYNEDEDMPSLEQAPQKSISDRIPALDSFIKSQCGLLEKILSHERHLKTIRSQIQQIISGKEVLIQKYFKVFKKSPSKYYSTISLLIAPRGSSLNKLYAKMKPTLLQCYESTIFDVSSAPPNHVQRSFEDLAKTITHQEFSEQLLPTIERMLKRNPGTILQSLIALLRNLPLDLSRYVRALFPPACSELRNKNEKRRQMGIEFAALLVDKTSDTTALAEIFNTTCDYLAGKKGAIGQWTERETLVSTLGAYKSMSAIGDASRTELAQLVVDFLLVFLKREAHKNVREAALLELFEWSKLLKSIPDAVLRLFMDGVEGKGPNIYVVPTVLGVLISLVQMNDDIPAEVFKDSEKIIDLLKSASGKPKLHRHSGLLAITLLSYAPVHLAQALEDLWVPLVEDSADNSWVNKIELIKSSSPEEGVAYSTLFATLVKNHKQLIFGDPDKYTTLFAGITHQAVHSSWKSRRHCLTSIRDSCSQVPELHVYLVQNYFEMLRNIERMKKSGPLPSNLDFGNALLCISSSPRHDLVPQIALMAHHPRVRIKQKDVSSTWKKLAKRWSHADEKEASIDVKSVFSQESSTLKTMLFEDGILGDDLQFRSASIALLTTIAQNVPDLMLCHFFEPLINVLAAKELRATSRSDIDIYKTPEGELVTLQDEMKFQGRGKGRRTEDEAWEAQLAAELKKKKKNPGVDSDTKQKMEEQSKIRAHVGSLVSSVLSALMVVESIAKACPITTRNHFAQRILPSLYDLIRCPAVQIEASNTLVRLATCMESKVRASVVARVITGVIKDTDGAFKDEDSARSISEVLAILQKAVGVLQDDEDGAARARAGPAVRGRGGRGRGTFRGRVRGRGRGRGMRGRGRGKGFGRGQPDEDDKKSLDPDFGQNRGIVKKSDQMLSNPSLVFIFPLLKASVLNGQPETVKQALDVIAQHCDAGVNEGKIFVRFPTEDFVTALLHVLAKHANLQGQAKAALLRLAPAITPDEMKPLLQNAGILSRHPHVRKASLQALSRIPSLIPPHSPILASRIWIACHDDDETVKSLAEQVWDKFSFELGEDFLDILLGLLSHDYSCIRKASGLSIAAGLGLYPDQTRPAVERLIGLYKNGGDQKVYDEFRRKFEVVSNSRTRSGALKCIGACGPHYGPPQLLAIFLFLTSAALSDQERNVWDNALKAGLQIIEEHGQKQLPMMLPIFETVLAKGSKKQDQDRIREGTVVFMGTLAKFLVDDKDSGTKLLKVVNSLIRSLSTPSYAVQSAVSHCLSPLMKHQTVEDQSAKLIKQLLKKLTESKTYADRKGAAFGLAGVVKGLGIPSLKKNEIMDKLAVYVKDTDKWRVREGALLAYDMMFSRLGQPFEPYVIHILPHMLRAFGDGHKEVRQATRDASKTVMANLSRIGIQMVMPQILTALEDYKWRTKLESIGMLGAMAYCAPKQLSSCLPQIVPPILNVLADPHAKVQKAGEKALGDIGKVVRNPEVLGLVPVLLKSLTHPSDQGTRDALQALIDTSFVSSVDAPSLALIVPILMRGLKVRKQETKRMSAQIIGSICSFIMDVSDIEPYAESLIEGVKEILVDPIPEVRAAAGRALGSLHAGLGEDRFDDMAGYLMEMLQSDTTKVQRSGAAQGLAELIAAFGNERLEEMMPQIMQNCRHESPLVREGCLQMFIFLPKSFGASFQPYIEQVMPFIRKGLSDEKEPVRNVSLQAGKVIVFMFGRSDTEHLLDLLEAGLFDQNARIRDSSVHLIGDLLHGLSGAGGSFVQALDDELTEEAEQAIMDRLGPDRRDSILSAIYICRSDTVSAVKQTAWQVWKCIVANTPRMLRKILPELMSTVIDCLSSDSEERQDSAGRALGELVKRTGDQVLPEIIPFLKNKLEATDANTRTGVCLGLSTVLASANKAHIAEFMIEVIPAVQQALCDELPQVREASGHAFQTLLKNIGVKAVDEVVPELVYQLDGRNADLVIQGIKQVLLASRTTEPILAYVIPKLIEEPMTPFHAEALATLSPVFDKDLYRFLPHVCKALVRGIVEEKKNGEEKDATEDTYQDEFGEDEDLDDMKDISVRDSAREFVLKGVVQQCVHQLLTSFTDMINNTDDSEVRIACADLIAHFCKETKTDFTEDLSLILQALLQLYVDQSEEAQIQGRDAMSVLIKITPKDMLSKHISSLRNCIGNLVASKITNKRLEVVPGFCLKNGLQPILPMFQHGLMHGSVETREQAAAGLGEIVELTTPAALRPYVIKITGPLIRVVGDRFAAPVKSAILYTLGLLLTKTGKYLKPFLPQLQTTFVKALHDDSRTVRQRGASSLATLMELSTRVDSLVGELNTTIRGKPDPDIRTSMLNALEGVLMKVGSKTSKPVLANVRQTLEQFTDDADNDDVRVASATCLGVLCGYLDVDDRDDLFSSFLFNATSGWRERHGRVVLLKSMLEHCDDIQQYDVQQIVEFVHEHLKDDNAVVRAASTSCCTYLLLALSTTDDVDLSENVLSGLVTLGRDSISMVRLGAMEGLELIGRKIPELAIGNLDLIVPTILKNLSDSNTPARLAANKCLYYVLQIHNDNEILNNYMRSVSDEFKTILSMHCRKMKYM